MDLGENIIITETVWTTTGINETILDTASLNLFSLINDATDKSLTVSDNYDILSVVGNGIKTTYRGSKTEHTIRLTFDINTGNTQFYRVELRRSSDDSVINIFNVFRNPDETRQTVNIITRTLSATDPFVVPGGGFYLAFVNNSGLSATITGTMQLLIINKYQMG